MQNNQLYIEYLKSGISISTDTGCSLSCRYCIVDEFSAGQSCIKLSPEYIANEICNFKLYNPNTPIMINNRTDPLLPGVKDNTFKLLEILEERGIQNPRVIISKLTVGDKYLDRFDHIKTPVFLFRTFSGMPSNIEPVSSFNNFQKMISENIKLQQYANIHHVHYWRPIIPGINSDKQLIKQIINMADAGFDCSVVSGIRLTDHLYDKLTGFGADLSGWNHDTNHKYLDANIYNDIISTKNTINPQYNIFRNTSCAISALLNRADYNLNFIKKRFCDGCVNTENCANHQVSEITKHPALNGIDYVIDKDTLIVTSPVSQEQISFIKHCFGYNVQATQILKDKSELLIEKSTTR